VDLLAVAELLAQPGPLISGIIGAMWVLSTTNAVTTTQLSTILTCCGTILTLIASSGCDASNEPNALERKHGNQF
jgi:hypothetical protein